MIVEDPDNYKLIGFRKSSHAGKKYDGIIQHKQTGKIKTIPFGDDRYDHFEDKTPLQYYSSQNHYDEKRRENYHRRHRLNTGNKFSSGWFAGKYLW